MKQFILSLVATFCLTAVGQDVCRPPMVSFGVHREELKDGWLHSTGGMVNETRMLEVDYFDNRRIDQFEFNSQGWVDMTTISENSRKLKYRHKVPINFGEYTISQDSTTMKYAPLMVSSRLLRETCCIWRD